MGGDRIPQAVTKEGLALSMTFLLSKAEKRRRFYAYLIAADKYARAAGLQRRLPRDTQSIVFAFLPTRVEEQTMSQQATSLSRWLQGSMQ